ncbi:MAG: site-specific integrase [Planctomycetes bacterium]|nr:site-specific integrase [Planctomycetota bacterium]
MARSRLPKPVRHKSGQAVVFLTDPATGKRRAHYLGTYGSADAGERYRAILGEFLAGKPIETPAHRSAILGPAPAADACTVGRLVAQYLTWAERYYVDDQGAPTGVVTGAKYAFRFLLAELQDRPTAQVRACDLLAVRQRMIDYRPAVPAGEDRAPGRQAPQGLSRRSINDRMQTILRLFRWGVVHGMVPGGVWHELSAIKGLPKGRCGVHDNPPVQAVPWPIVEATLRELTPTLRAAVLVQWHTGARPAEVLRMTRRQIDTSGELWVYKPEKHKCAWRGHARAIVLGSEAQAALLPFLSLAPDDPVFSPKRAWAEFAAAKRAARETPETKQTRDREARAAAADAALGDFYDVDAYRRAIVRAADRADVPRWSPHKLRHAFGTRVAASMGIEIARAALGHSDLSTTRRYASGADLELAKRAAAKHG